MQLLQLIIEYVWFHLHTRPLPLCWQLVLNELPLSCGTTTVAVLASKQRKQHDRPGHAGRS